MNSTAPPIADKHETVCKHAVPSSCVRSSPIRIFPPEEPSQHPCLVDRLVACGTALSALFLTELTLYS